MTPPRPPPKPVAGPSQMTAHSQPGPHNPNYHYVSTGSRAGPGAYGRQGHSLPRMSSTPDITRSYAYSGGHYPADHKLPPSPAPITIEPPFHVAMAHRESPTAPRAIDLGYGPASPAIDGPAGGMVRPPTPRSSFSSPAIVFPTMASPAPYGSLASPPRHQPPVGDYFTVTSLAPAPAPAMIPLATNMTMAPASAPRFSLVFGTSSSTAPSTQAGMAAASMATAAAAAATTPAAPLAMVTGNAGQTGMMVLSPSHDGGDGGVAPPYAPSAANGHRTL
ncbi:hypothetical protein DFQ26_009542 [Actinomortierella ambigua]|nr:hypothetical protein DFQ26_009542 [Actinomortierella ambigua]